MPKPRDEIERLKANWCGDPCWEIEFTEGFEEHEAELRLFREQTQARWQAENRAWAEAKAAELGCAGNHALGLYILLLEERLAELEARIERAGV